MKQYLTKLILLQKIPTEISKNLPSKNTIENSIDTSMLTDLKTSVEDLNTKYSSLESLVKATADNIPAPQASDTNSELSSKISNLEEKLDAFNDIINTLGEVYDRLYLQQKRCCPYRHG